MSGHRKGRGAKPGVGLAAPKKPWEKRYQRGLTPLRAKMPAYRPAMAAVREVAKDLPETMVSFKAKPGLGGRRHRLRRARAAGGVQ